MDNKQKSYTYIHELLTPPSFPKKNTLYLFVKLWWLLLFLIYNGNLSQFLAPHNLKKQLPILVLNLNKHKSATLALV